MPHQSLHPEDFLKTMQMDKMRLFGDLGLIFSGINCLIENSSCWRFFPPGATGEGLDSPVLLSIVT